MQQSSISKTFLFSLCIFALNFLIQSIKISDVIQNFLLFLYSQGFFEIVLKHRGCLDIPITNGANFFEPSELVKSKTVNRSLLSFPPKHFSPLYVKVLLDKIL